jgi:hypothetical protein
VMAGAPVAQQDAEGVRGHDSGSFYLGMSLLDSLA